MGENKYKNGKIYKIVDVGYSKCYIGSTCESLSKRMARHRSSYNQYLNGVFKKSVRSFELFDEFGFDNCKIELIENHPCKNNEELHKREGHHIKQTECVNKLIAGRTQQEWVKDNAEHLAIYNKKHRENMKDHYQEYWKQYHQDNKESRNEKQREYDNLHKETRHIKQKEYRENKKEQIANQQQRWYVNNRDMKLTKSQEHYEQNKQKILARQAEIITCSCGVEHRRGNKSRHIKTQQHQEWLMQQEE